MHILVVEDEVKLASLIRRGLREEGLLADVAITGEDALWMAGSTERGCIRSAASRRSWHSRSRSPSPSATPGRACARRARAPAGAARPAAAGVLGVSARVLSRRGAAGHRRSGNAGGRT